MFLSACGGPQVSEEALAFAKETIAAEQTATADAISPTPVPPTQTDTPEPTDTETSTLTPDYTATITLTPSDTPTITMTPTIDYPEGKVLGQTNCRYGPGAAYLYEYGLYEGYKVKVIGRNELGTWIYVLAQGFPSGCWMRADLAALDGDIFSVPPYYGLLPKSDLYPPISVVSAVRDGDKVTIFWQEVYMTQDDYRGYLIEAWLCVDGQIVFTPIHIDGLVTEVIDEDGCMEPSSARIYVAEKHGYTNWRLILWPSYDVTPTPVTASPTP
jgi:hypothetical protein